MDENKTASEAEWEDGSKAGYRAGWEDAAKWKWSDRFWWMGVGIAFTLAMQAAGCV